MPGDMEAEILKKIKPSPQEEEKIKQFVNELLRVSKTVSGLDCVVCGSIGKFTWLRGDHDIDLFILFPKSAPREELEKKGLECGKRIASELKGTHVIKYAEHPYVRADANGYVIDIVPCYRIGKNEKIISAVDRSPLHLEYVLENLDAKKRDEARLLKQFCKGVSVYGSDTRHLGFSGYLCELMIIRSGSFVKAIKDAAKWGAPKIIGAGDAKKFPNQPLVLMDPVDTKRNVAANISCENFVKFVSAARKFTDKPEEKYFFKEKSRALAEEEVKRLAGRGTQFCAIVSDKPDIIDDVLYPQMRKAVDRIATALRQNEFLLLKSAEYANGKMVLLFEMEVFSLPNVKKMTGPNVFSKKHQREFRSKYKNDALFVEDIYWVAEKEREFRLASQLLKHILAKSAEELNAMGIPDNIAKALQRGRFVDGKDFWDFVKDDYSFSAFLKEKYFTKMNSENP